ncbi:glycosyl transferase, family I [Desulfosarcina variabilis str. Montpellier]|uniref:glycosyltransferase family 4 protein n=1 Tax=Desulfosarcina variabilis TaxID=2300 RepID=UPI003AFB4E5E
MGKRPLTIIHTESHRSWGGQEIRVITECLWMKKKGHRAILIASKKSQIYPKAKAAGLDVLPMSFTNLTALGDLIRLRGWLKSYAPDVLNTHGNMDAKVGLLAAAGLKVPCVIRSRHHSHPVTPSWYNKLLYRKLSDYIFTSAQCISDQIVNDLAVDPSKVVTVSSGFVPPGKMISKPDAMHRLQKEFDLDPDTRFIGSVAMLSEWKGHRFLIDAFKAICGQFPHHHLMIVGDGAQMQALIERARDHGLADRIHFAGFREDPWPFFRAFDINILASTKNEATSQVLPQAMYAGCPVIGTWAGGIPEVIDHGNTGYLVEPADSVALARAMQMILKDPASAAELAMRAQKMASENYTMTVMVDRILDQYQKRFSLADGQRTIGPLSKAG